MRFLALVLLGVALSIMLLLAGALSYVRLTGLTPAVNLGRSRRVWCWRLGASRCRPRCGH